MDKFLDWLHINGITMEKYTHSSPMSDLKLIDKIFKEKLVEETLIFAYEKAKKRLVAKIAGERAKSIDW